MNVESVLFTTSEGGQWQELALTPSETSILEEHLNTVINPILSGNLPMPAGFKFMPKRKYHAFKIHGRCWCVVCGWRSC